MRVRRTWGGLGKRRRNLRCRRWGRGEGDVRGEGDEEEEREMRKRRGRCKRRGRWGRGEGDVRSLTICTQNAVETVRTPTDEAVANVFAISVDTRSRSTVIKRYCAVRENRLNQTRFPAMYECNKKAVGAKYTYIHTYWMGEWYSCKLARAQIVLYYKHHIHILTEWENDTVAS